MKRILCIIAISALCLGFGPGIGADNEIELQQIKRRLSNIPLIIPDLVLEKIELKSEPYSSDKIKITISYWIYNDSSADSRCCPTEDGEKEWEKHPAMNLLYYARVESRAYPRGRFSQLGGLVGTETKAHERQKYTAVHIVKKGSKWQYRATADYKNLIHEKNENNNQKTQIWPMRIRF